MRHYCINGTVQDIPRSGRAPLLNSDAQNRLVRAIERHPKQSPAAFGKTVGVSGRTVVRIAATYGLRSCICRKKPFISEVNKDKRVKWARDTEGTQWRRIMYTDEAAFRIGDSGVERCL